LPKETIRTGGFPFSSTDKVGICKMLNWIPDSSSAKKVMLTACGSLAAGSTEGTCAAAIERGLAQAREHTELKICSRVFPGAAA